MVALSNNYYFPNIHRAQGPKDRAREDRSRKKCHTRFVPGDLDLCPLTPNSNCTMYLTTKFHCPTFNRSEFIVLTNKLTDKQTPLKTSTSLRYATPVGKNSLDVLVQA